MDIFTRQVSLTGKETHGIVEESLETTAVYSVHRIHIAGEYNLLKAQMNTHYCNEIVTGRDTWIFNFPGCYSDCVILSMSLNRTIGGRGILIVTVKAFQRGYIASIDFGMEAQNILKWRALCAKNRPSLDAIRYWQTMKTREEWLDYYNNKQFIIHAPSGEGKVKIVVPGDADSGGDQTLEFLDGEIVDLTLPYTDNTSAASDTARVSPNGIGSPVTAKLAEMILNKGIEYFPEYTPTLNITYTLAAHPAQLGIEDFKPGMYLGCVIPDNLLVLTGKGFDRPIGSISNYPSPVNDFITMYDGVNVCTGDQLRCNSDGSYTLTRAFTKYRAVEPELYVGAGGVYGPYDINTLPGSKE